ncbi:MAG: type I-PGING CRISPR-associated protein Cas7/Csp1 [Melioribacteraceae bacterium]|nr:type I-PGING CRISPR-associated protein Cas7/Csp1 [Melioribacteraceae bacterium]
MQNIKGILVTLLAPMENHIANAGEKLLGNVSSIKRRPDERVYISGQMQRHALFSALERLNWADSQRGSTYVSNGDGIDNRIELNLRSDLGGFMDPNGGNYSGRRTSPLSVTPAVALDESQIGRDLLLKLKNMDRDHSLATKEFSQMDLMVMNFFLDISSLSISKRFTYDDGGFHLETEFIKHVVEDERKRRVKLFLEATRSITDYANQARNAVCGEPQQVLIIFDSKLSRKASRYFQAEEKERKNIIAEIDNRDAIHYLGNDLEGDTSVDAAYSNALDMLNNEETTLFDPCEPDSQVMTFAEAFNLNEE